MRRADLVRMPQSRITSRTTQIVFGERQHLLRVLDSIEKTTMPSSRVAGEKRAIESLIHARTKELDSINPGWDLKVGVVLNADTRAEALEAMAHEAPPEDFYLLRLISEHPKAATKTLARLGKHPYPAIRENVARHPNTDSATLAKLCQDRTQPLWYLVAFNPNTPAALRAKLQARMRKLGEAQQTA
jgi:Leucine rich repeat variant